MDNGKRRRPKPENELLARRIQAAMDAKGWSRQDLVRDLVQRGVMAPDPKNPEEPSAKGAVHYWLTGQKRPSPRVLGAMAAGLGQPMAYFTDPDYHDKVNEQVLDRVTELVLRVVRSGRDFVSVAEEYLGTPHLLNTRDRRFYRANQKALLDDLAAGAPRPWAEMTATEQREYVRSRFEQLADEEE